jgi:putative SOS response-associated peptidase YedK
MCAVDRTQAEDGEALAEAFGITPADALGPLDQTNYPMRPRPVVLLRRDGTRGVREMNWGLVPAWASDVTFGRHAFNCRIESLVEGKPAFRDAFTARRCLLIGTSYVEHRTEEGRKVPYEFSVDGGRPYAYAGLWEVWQKEGRPFLSCTMITAPPNETAALYHDRMPAILRPEDYALWLDPAAPPEALLPLLGTLEAFRLQARQTELRPRLQSGLFEDF